jgi:hypothetical protein
VNFYAPSKEGLKQGDILYPIPFPLLPLKQDGFTPSDNGKPLSLLDLDSLANETTVTLEFAASVSWGMVITQNCDLAEVSKENIVIARIFKASERFPAFPTMKEKDWVGTFKNSGKRPNYLYLPKNPDAGLEHSVVYLLETQTFAYFNKSALLKTRKATLSQLARAALQERLAYCFGRVALPDDFYTTPKESP